MEQANELRKQLVWHTLACLSNNLCRGCSIEKASQIWIATYDNMYVCYAPINIRPHYAPLVP